MTISFSTHFHFYKCNEYMCMIIGRSRRGAEVAQAPSLFLGHAQAREAEKSDFWGWVSC